MFHVGNIPTLDQEQFGEFWNFLGIFKNSTKLRNNRKREKTENRKTLTWRLLTGPPAGPAQLPRQRAAWLGQAGRQVLDGDRAARHAAARRLASSPRRPGGMVRPSTSSSTPQTPPPPPSSSPPLSPRHGRRRRVRTVVELSLIHI